MPAKLSAEETKRREESLIWARDNGKTDREAAENLGLSAKTFGEWKRNRMLDPAIQDSMIAVGTGLVPALAWAKTKNQDGTSYSVLLKPPVEAIPDLIERLQGAFSDVPAAMPVPAPEQVMSNLLALYPLMDAHVGMHAWGAETGGADYDLKLAVSDIVRGFAKVTAITPNAAAGLLIVGGDFFHADDNRAETPAHRHKLDVDGRMFKVVDAGVAVLAHVIDSLLHKHQTVRVRVLRGNHDEHSSVILTFALSERYRSEPRVTVDKDPRDLFMMQWGKCAIFAHHGDKAKPQSAALYVSDICPFWSNTRHRHYFTGHVHHDQAKDVGPLRWESLRAFCPPDAYAASMGFGGRRALQSVTFDQQSGIVLRAFDPLERES